MNDNQRWGKHSFTLSLKCLSVYSSGNVNIIFLISKIRKKNVYKMMNDKPLPGETIFYLICEMYVISMVVGERLLILPLSILSV